MIRNGFFSDGSDLERLVAGMRLTLDICGRPALRGFGSEPDWTPDGDSDEAIAAHVARTVFPIYHPVGTCAIGSVVDEDLRVQGLDGIRVVDCSVMPSVPRGNTNAPVIAVAERAADLIKGATPLRAGAEAAAGAQ